MEFRIAKTEFLRGLRLAQGIADHKSTMPMLANVLLRTQGATSPMIVVSQACKTHGIELLGLAFTLMRPTRLAISVMGIAAATVASTAGVLAVRAHAPADPLDPVDCAPELLPPPVPLRLVHHGGYDPKLELFLDESSSSALDCPEDRDEDQPAGSDQHRCAFRAVTALGLAGHTVWGALAMRDSEHDGMSTHEESIVLLDPGPQPRAITTLDQWNSAIGDCRSRLVLRRHRELDLDGDGRDELCIETVEEEGIGLFEVMKLNDQGMQWEPNRRTRRIEAFVLDPVRARLERAPQLDAGCPRLGYARFIDTPIRDAPFAWRVSIQGERAPAPCPARDQVNECFDVCD